MGRYLRRGPFAQIAGMGAGAMHSPVIAVAVLLSSIGVFAFSAVLLRLV
jgi:putative membrane protein